MFRLFLVSAAVVCTLHCDSAQAQGRGKGWNRGGNKHGHGHVHKNYRSRPSSSFGFSISIGGYPGYGYGYPGPLSLDPYRDPYRTGRFQVPDLHDDPWFTEQHRYDSQFPGRRSRAPLVVVPTAPAVNYPSYGNVPASAYPSAPIVPSDSADLVGQLHVAAAQLTHSLSARHDGNAWLGYLAPNQIGNFIEAGKSADLRELLTHYDGVVGNSQLRNIAALQGFGTTRHLLRKYVNQSQPSAEPRFDAPPVEALPIPKPTGEALPIPDAE